MNKKRYAILGVMSGTSLDGVDLSHIIFDVNTDSWSFQIQECETIPYSVNWLHQLKIGVNLSKQELNLLDQEYTQLLGTTIKSFLAKHQISKLDAVCSHGHTILHQPENKYTLQIGNIPIIAKICQQKVVCDFRVQDVLLGGQGAPLVPIGDRILFSDYDYCLNLGGFSNISFEFEGNRIAFDISPVNTVLNLYANQLGHAYDDRGKIARVGCLDSSLFDKLNQLDYYQKSFPKSLGIEYVNAVVLPLIDSHLIPVEAKLNTFSEHVAHQIELALPVKKGKLLVTGGGAYNTFIIERMQHHLPEMEIIIPDSKIVEYKEALIFGLLGVLRMRNEINVLASVTGAKKDHCSGMIYE